MTTKPDLSREAVERLIVQCETPEYYAGDRAIYEVDSLAVATTLRALLDAKEAAEAERDQYRERLREMKASRRGWIDFALRAKEALKVAGDYLEACQVNNLPDLAEASRMPFISDVIKQVDAALTPPADDAAALEALIREGKADGWDEGFDAWHYGRANQPNPYRHKKGTHQ